MSVCALRIIGVLIASTTSPNVRAEGQGRRAEQKSPPVTGVVLDSATKAPVPAARVVLARVDGPLTASVMTTADNGGEFTLRDAPAGRYRVFAEQEDYLRGELGGVVSVPAEQAATKLTIALTPTAVISGRVLNDLGAPAQKVLVRAQSGNTIVEARTNDLGEYRLFGLAPGAYVISAQRYTGPRIENGRYVVATPPSPDAPGEGAFLLMLAPLLSSGGFLDPSVISGLSWPTVFYPGTTEAAQAQPVEAGPGARVSGIDLRLVVR